LLNNELPGGVPPDSFDRNCLLSYLYAMQALRPSTPARAEATAITTLMITLQVDFDFFSMRIVI
jgi:hypothetical protein